DLPAPIFFLGAGVSKSGNIPLAGDIVKHILEVYKLNPEIQKLPEAKRTYADVMNCLSPAQRNRLLKGYIDEAKINVAHIYLAQMYKKGFLDYVLTVNFDNLMLRALALYDEFPPTYDLAILKDFTTTSPPPGSVIYLHGQHHGLWLLNTLEELNKVEHSVPAIFHKITNQRPWIFIGYSGDDPIFNHVQSLGRFDNGLYWVTYKDKDPGNRVKTLLRKANTNAFIIKGFDADTFLLKLTKLLGLDQPAVIQKPFTTLKGMLDNIVDVKDEGQYKLVHERLNIVREQVDESIERYEQDENSIEFIKKQLLDMLVNEAYDEQKLTDIENKIGNRENEELNKLLSAIYYNWGISLSESAKLAAFEAEKKGLYHKSIEKYQKATQIDPDPAEAYNNWGNTLFGLAKLTDGKEAIDYYLLAFEKYQKATLINPDLAEAYYNWGVALYNLAKLTDGKEAIDYYHQAIEKYERATQINPDSAKAYTNWGVALAYLVKLTDGNEAIDYYLQAIEKCQKATQINPDDVNAYSNWGNVLVTLARLKSGTDRLNLLNKALEVSHKAYKSGGKAYSLACAYALLKDTDKALTYLEEALTNREIPLDLVENDPDWDGLRNDPDFLALLGNYREA
ncbi:MAG: tetratricopeptide repeat protein, partial [Cyclobacteriaceae bacterium]